MDIETMKARAEAHRPRLDELKLIAKARLEACSPGSLQGAEALREAFDLIATAESNATALLEATGLVWGFGPFDARFLGSLRDQVQGIGLAQRDLTRAQLATVRTMLVADKYTTQLALLWD